MVLTAFGIVLTFDPTRMVNGIYALVFSVLMCSVEVRAVRETFVGPRRIAPDEHEEQHDVSRAHAPMLARRRATLNRDAIGGGPS